MCFLLQAHIIRHICAVLSKLEWTFGNPILPIRSGLANYWKVETMTSETVRNSRYNIPPPRQDICNAWMQAQLELCTGKQGDRRHPESRSCFLFPIHLCNLYILACHLCNERFRQAPASISRRKPPFRMVQTPQKAFQAGGAQKPKERQF